MLKGYVILTLLSFLSFIAEGQHKNQSAVEFANKIPANKIIEWRRHIHQNPELSFNEVGTSKFVEDILKSLGNIEVSRPTATSAIGILKGSKPGPTVAFRADMDALPIAEETGLSYSSTTANVSHGCGHDAHTAMLLGTATTLSQLRNQIRGTIYFIFQHAEESPPGGALEIIKTGALKNVEAFFGMHVLPNFPVGYVGILPDGPASTTWDGFSLTINGKGSHGSMPHLGIDPIVVGAEIVTTLQTVVSRNVVPGELAVISIGKFTSGEAANVIPQKAELAATIRSTSETTRKLIEERVKSIVEHVTKAHNAEYKLTYVQNYPAIQNDPLLNSIVRKSVQKNLGQDKVFDAPMMTASEDFSYFRQVAPICFMTLGVGNGAANHNPKFNIDEQALVNGVSAQVQIILDYLNTK